ncbi:MAG: hypothetical protein WC966_08340 [Bradymonadales bacterium]
MFTIPLFRAFGYEFHLAFALFIVLLYPFIHAGKDRGLGRSIFRITASTCVLFAELSLLALWSGNLCSFGESVAYFLLLPLCSAIVVSALFYIIRKRTRPKLAFIIYYMLFLASILLSLWHLWSQARIVEFDPFFGFFAGSIYDESMHIYEKLALYRLANLWLLVLLFSLGELLAMRKEASASLMRKKFFTILALLSLLLLSFWYFMQARWGIQVDRAELRRNLNAEIRTEHFRIFYDASKGDAEWAHYLAQAHEQAYSELLAFFVLEPTRLPIDSYVYPDYKTKGRLMGSERTSVSKVWLNELHMLGVEPNSSLIKHELAHTFAAAFAPWPLKLAGGLIPAMGWVEGIAVATQWPINEGNPHRWASEILEWDDKIDVQELFTAQGFWRQPSRKAYTLVGSYVRFLWDTWGAEAVMALSNGGDFEATIGMSANEFYAAWRGFLRIEYAPSPEFSALSKRYFDKQSIFERRCARNIASQFSGITDLLLEAKNDEALKELERIAADCDGAMNLYSSWLRLWTLARGKALDKAWREGLPMELYGDYLWRVEGKSHDAHYMYMRASLEADTSDSDRLRLAVKIAALQQRAVKPLLGEYLFMVNAKERLAFLEAVSEGEHFALYHYVLGLEYFERAHFVQAKGAFSQALRSAQLSQWVEDDARYKLISTSLYMSDYRLAAIHSLYYLLAAKSRGRYERISHLWGG